MEEQNYFCMHFRKPVNFEKQLYCSVCTDGCAKCEYCQKISKKDAEYEAENQKAIRDSI